MTFRIAKARLLPFILLIKKLCRNTLFVFLESPRYALTPRLESFALCCPQNQLLPDRGSTLLLLCMGYGTSLERAGLFFILSLLCNGWNLSWHQGQSTQATENLSHHRCHALDVTVAIDVCQPMRRDLHQTFFQLLLCATLSAG